MSLWFKLHYFAGCIPKCSMSWAIEAAAIQLLLTTDYGNVDLLCYTFH